MVEGRTLSGSPWGRGLVLSNVQNVSQEAPSAEQCLLSVLWETVVCLPWVEGSGVSTLYTWCPALWRVFHLHSIKVCLLVF